MIPPTANAKVVAFASSDSHDVMPIVRPDLCLNTSMRSCISVKYDSSATNTIVSLPGSYSRNAPTQRTTNYATSDKTVVATPTTYLPLPPIPTTYPYHHTTHSSESALDSVIASAVFIPTQGHPSTIITNPRKKRTTSPLPGGSRLRSFH